MENKLQHQAYLYDNQMPKTFDDMCTYLQSKENCSIQGDFFTIIDMHKFCKLAMDRITLIKPELRNKNIMCTTTKGSMQRAFDAYIDGKIDSVGVRNKKPFSNY